MANSKNNDYTGAKALGIVLVIVSLLLFIYLFIYQSGVFLYGSSGSELNACGGAGEIIFEVVLLILLILGVGIFMRYYQLSIDMKKLEKKVEEIEFEDDNSSDSSSENSGFSIEVIKKIK